MLTQTVRSVKNSVMIQVDQEISLDIRTLPKELLYQIKKDLTLPNPEFERAKKHCKDPYQFSPIIQMYTELDTHTLRFPRGYGSVLIRRLLEANLPYQIHDQRTIYSKVGFELSAKVKLRDYQEEAVKRLVRIKQGGITAPCGAGKTIIMLSAMAAINQRTLWITHTQELANQTMERAYQVLNLMPGEIGMIGAGKKLLGRRFTVGLVQTLNRMDLCKLSQWFGCILVDEAHHIPASTFYDTVNQFSALYRLWVSATPDRSDGLKRMIFIAGGPILYEIDRSRVPTMTPKLVVKETPFNGNMRHYSKLMTKLCNDTARNELIVDTVLSEVHPDNYLLILSERVEHLKILAAMLQAKRPDVKYEILTGSLPRKSREQIMANIQAREFKILFATQLAREGLDITHLNRLFLTMPKRAEGAIEQECGRIMRPSEGKTDAVVYDFADINNGILENQFRNRLNVYQKLGMIKC